MTKSGWKYGGVFDKQLHPDVAVEGRKLLYLDAVLPCTGTVNDLQLDSHLQRGGVGQGGESGWPIEVIKAEILITTLLSGWTDDVDRFPDRRHFEGIVVVPRKAEMAWKLLAL